MDKLRIGIIVDENALATEGGGYTYYQSLLESINNYVFHPEIEMVNIAFSGKWSHGPGSKKQVIYIRKNLIHATGYFILDMLYRLWFRSVRKRYPSAGDRILARMATIRNRSAVPVLKREDIDLVYYLKPEDNILNYPLMVTHWDVGHKSMYPFPEVAMNGSFKKREAYYVKMLSKAFLILCESETGMAELLKYYPINPDKVKVLPLFSGEVIRQQVPAEQQQQVLAKFGLQRNGYFLYPAQFWAHKNHYNLVLAFYGLLQKTGNDALKLVLCGTDKGNLEYIRNLVARLGLNSKVLFPGFVSDPELYVLYKSALALVMPTYLGPTNIPLIEAAHLHCPVLCSDIPGHKEILGDTAMYFNPAHGEEITGCMEQVLNAENRSRISDQAFQRISSSRFNVEKSMPVLQQILLHIKPVRKAWGIHMSLLLSVITYANTGVINA